MHTTDVGSIVNNAMTAQYPLPEVFSKIQNRYVLTPYNPSYHGLCSLSRHPPSLPLQTDGLLWVRRTGPPAGRVPGWTQCWPWKCHATASDGCPADETPLWPLHLVLTLCTRHSPWTHDLNNTQQVLWIQTRHTITK